MLDINEITADSNRLQFNVPFSLDVILIGRGHEDGEWSGLRLRRLSRVEDEDGASRVEDGADGHGSLLLIWVSIGSASTGRFSPGFLKKWI